MSEPALPLSETVPMEGNCRWSFRAVGQEVSLLSMCLRPAAFLSERSVNGGTALLCFLASERSTVGLDRIVGCGLCGPRVGGMGYILVMGFWE